MESYRKLRATNIISNFFNLSGIQLSNMLLILLTIPVITRKIGLVEYGVIMVANRFALLAGSIINYGTGQSGIRDAAFHLNDPKKLSLLFFNIIYIRAAIFGVFLVLLIGFRPLLLHYYPYPYPYFLFALPIAFAEVINPLCFFIGVERLRVFNLHNLVFNVLAVLALVFFINGPADARWVNFILGTGNVITYLLLALYFIAKFKLPFYLADKDEILKTLKDNFYLTVNNISINLQQSIIVFALPKCGYAALLGPYNLCDKVIGQCRNLLITISNALYPNAVLIYKRSAKVWQAYRQKTKYLIAGLFFCGSISIYFLADFIVFILTKEHDAHSILFLKIMAFVPTISALNVMNVMDQLLKNHAVNIFRIALLLFVVAMIVVFAVLSAGNYMLIAAFTLIVETSAWLMYEVVIRKKTLKNV